MNQPMILTQSGLDELKRELADLVDAKRPLLVDRLSLARSMGDLSENSDYISAREELEFMDGRIAQLEDLIKNSQVVTAQPAGSGIAVGSKVTVKVGSSQHVFHIVGEWEADPAQKKISPSSPLGKALVGKNVGEVTEVAAPAGKVVYTIVSID